MKEVWRVYFCPLLGESLERFCLRKWGKVPSLPETSSGGERERGRGGRGGREGGRSGGREGGRKEKGKWNVGRDDAVLKGGEKGVTSWHSAGRAGTERKTALPAQVQS